MNPGDNLHCDVKTIVLKNDLNAVVITFERAILGNINLFRRFSDPLFCLYRTLINRIPKIPNDIQELIVENYIKKLPESSSMHLKNIGAYINIFYKIIWQRTTFFFQIFDFELSEKDMKDIDGLNRNWRACVPKVKVTRY